MKKREGFVSNSSSSSFIIRKENLNDDQKGKIFNHIEASKGMIDIDYRDEGDAWDIEEDEYIIKGSTWMDNFDMGEFLSRIGVSSKHIKWDEY